MRRRRARARAPARPTLPAQERGALNDNAHPWATTHVDERGRAARSESRFTVKCEGGGPGKIKESLYSKVRGRRAGRGPGVPDTCGGLGEPEFGDARDFEPAEAQLLQQRAALEAADPDLGKGRGVEREKER